MDPYTVARSTTRASETAQGTWVPLNPPEENTIIHLSYFTQSLFYWSINPFLNKGMPMSCSLESESVANPLNESHVDVARQCLVEVLADARNPLVTTKFGPDSAVLLHLLTQLQPDIPVLWIDTGYNRPETLRFAEVLTDQLALNTIVYRPLKPISETPPALHSPQHRAFTHDIKLEPFERALQELDPDVWISSIRHYQTAHRRHQRMIDTGQHGRLKVSPLIHWSAESVDQYLEKHQLPRGPEVNDPTKGEASRECGLHLVDAPAMNRPNSAVG